jgi:dihydroorotate dehydrogenase (NAD+) catalytic subunit
MTEPRVTLAGVEFNGPAFTASGCAAAGKELAAFFDLTEIGAVVTKSIMVRPRSGRPTPRMVETPSGMLNSIGLQGPGVESFLANDLAWLREHNVTAVVSIAGESVDEYGQLARILRNEPGIAALEVNISCPNVESRGQVFACDVMSASGVIHQVRRNTNSQVPIFAKLSPDVTSIAEIAQACHNAGADGFSVMNTTLGMAIDTDTLRPILGGVTGGLSGPAIRPMALRCVWQVHQALPDVPIIGMGGIASGADALQFVAAGASAVEVGTMAFHDPSAPVRVQRELLDLLDARGFATVAEAVGVAHRGGMA